MTESEIEKHKRQSAYTVAFWLLYGAKWFGAGVLFFSGIEVTAWIINHLL